VGVTAWKTEMLCEKPSRKGAVVPEFDIALHVVQCNISEGTIISGGDQAAPRPTLRRCIAGMDFGMRSPTVILFALEDEKGCLWVVDEIVESGRVVDDYAQDLLTGHASACASRGDAPWPIPQFVSVDPSGVSRTSVSHESPVSILRSRGLVIRAIRRRIELGIGLISSRLAPASGPIRLYVHERCRVLIDSLTRYRYASDDLNNLAPEKDGADHAVDALRYLITAVESETAGGSARYIPT
jgi:hypothetical protein